MRHEYTSCLQQYFFKLFHLLCLGIFLHQPGGVFARLRMIVRISKEFSALSKEARVSWENMMSKNPSARRRDDAANAAGSIAAGMRLSEWLMTSASAAPNPISPFRTTHHPITTVTVQMTRVARYRAELCAIPLTISYAHVWCWGETGRLRPTFS